MTESNQATMVDSAAHEDDEISLLDLLQVIFDNLRLLVLGPLVVGLLALGCSYTITPTFTATTKFLAPPPQQQNSAAGMLAGLGALGGLVGASSGIKNPADQYVAFLKSHSVQDAVIDRLKLAERYRAKLREDLRGAVSANVVIASSKDGFITINTSDRDPEFAALLANTHVEELSRLLNRLTLTEVQQRRAFFEKHLIIAKENLLKAELALKSSGVSSSVLKSTGAAVTAVAQLKGQIAAQEIKIAAMRGYLTESAPEFKQAQTEMTAIRLQLARSEREEPTAGDDESNYIGKLRDFKYHETLFDLFAKQYEMARVDESRESTGIQVLDVAQPPERKSSPKKARIAVTATLLAALALLVFVYLRHAMRHAAKSPESAIKVDRLRDALLRALGWKSTRAYSN